MIDSLKRRVIALLVVLITSAPVLAHDLFGETGERWDMGADLEQKGDFDSAIIQYNRALQAIKNIDNDHLRDCTTTGTIARLEGATAGKQYVQTYGRSSNSLNSALETSQSRFREVMDEIDTKRPDLATSCP